MFRQFNFPIIALSGLVLFGLNSQALAGLNSSSAVILWTCTTVSMSDPKLQVEIRRKPQLDFEDSYEIRLSALSGEGLQQLTEIREAAAEIVRNGTVVFRGTEGPTEMSVSVHANDSFFENVPGILEYWTRFAGPRYYAPSEVREELTCDQNAVRY